MMFQNNTLIDGENHFRLLIIISMNRTYEHELFDKGAVFRTDNGAEYEIVRVLAHGRFGDVYQVKPNHTGTTAIRTEDPRTPADSAQLATLETLFKAVKEVEEHWREHLPILLGKGVDPQPFLLVEAFDSHLDVVISEMMNEKATIDQLRKTTCYVALQTLRAIQELHRLNYVHRDVRLSAFRVRRDAAWKIVLTSFSYVKLKARGVNGKIQLCKIAPRLRTSARSTKLWSIGMEEARDVYTRNDDLESWAYMTGDMWGVSVSGLPWERLSKKEAVLQMKKDLISLDDSGDYVENQTVKDFNDVMPPHLLHIIRYLSIIEGSLDYEYLVRIWMDRVPESASLGDAGEKGPVLRVAMKVDSFEKVQTEHPTTVMGDLTKKERRRRQRRTEVTEGDSIRKIRLRLMKTQEDISAQEEPPHLPARARFMSREVTVGDQIRDRKRETSRETDRTKKQGATTRLSVKLDRTMATQD
ncbi:unnamed protein product, partial [Mesorhabditis belari]|uniref:Protein kinase domain-containing protein n=1 Tax=Mesorhabditis belari TaxID=2138241 RepID=A0AAF3EGH8_9BILA